MKSDTLSSRSLELFNNISECRKESQAALMRSLLYTAMHIKGMMPRSKEIHELKAHLKAYEHSVQDDVIDHFEALYIKLFIQRKLAMLFSGKNTHELPFLRDVLRHKLRNPFRRQVIKKFRRRK